MGLNQLPAKSGDTDQKGGRSPREKEEVDRIVAQKIKLRME
jgi:hypothetical protein